MSSLSLAVGLSCFLAAEAIAQRVTVLHTFTGPDGYNPRAGLILGGKTLYGTTYWGGGPGNGTVFAVNLDGSGFRTLHQFTPVLGHNYTNGDGANPATGLVLSGRTLYGTVYGGGGYGWGAVFAIDIDGSNFVVLHSFTRGEDGAFPNGKLLFHDNVLYGSTEYGGSPADSGVAFKLNVDGTGFTTLHVFTGFGLEGGDGRLALVGAVASDLLYGTTVSGGKAANGSVFVLNTNGSGFNTLYAFSAEVLNSSNVYVNGDGANPFAGCVLSRSTLYGTAQSGGDVRLGTVFSVNVDGSGFTTLHSFNNNDGSYPYGALSLSGEMLYGTTSWGGSLGSGTVFAIRTNGADFTSIYNFTDDSTPGTNRDGAFPSSDLVVTGDALYGTASFGGPSDKGTVFTISLSPQLGIISAGTNVIVSWPMAYAGFDYSKYRLQWTTNLASPVWRAISQGPVLVDGLNTVTNPIGAYQQFFRLIQ